MRRSALLSLSLLTACGQRVDEERSLDAAVDPPQPQAAVTDAAAGARLFVEAAEVARRGEPWLAGALERPAGLKASADGYVAEGRDHAGPITGDLDVSAARDARDGLAISIANVPRLGTKLVPIGAASVVGAYVDHRVAYQAVWPSTDVMLVAGARFAEYAFLLRDDRAPRRFSFAVRHESGIRDAITDASGDLVLLDAQSEPALRVRAPFAIDARGQKRAARMQLSGQTLTIELDPTGLAYPVVLDPTLDVPSWSRASTTYPENNYGAVVVANDLYLMAINGSTGSTFPSTVRRLDLTSTLGTWSSTSGPLGRHLAAGAIDPNGEIVVFGGFSGSAPMNNWASNSGTWTDRGAATDSVGATIPARVGPMAAQFTAKSLTDATVKYGVAIFGGHQYGTTYDDVFYRLTGMTNFVKYVPIASSGAPRTRAYGVFASDTKDSIYAAAGWDAATSTRLNDTWRLTWFWEKPVIGAGSLQAMWEPICGAGGKAACPFPARSSPAGGYDPVRKRVIMFGGDSGPSRYADLWELNPATGTWTEICGGSTTPTCDLNLTPRAVAGMACAKSFSTTKCYLMGGINGATQFTETWKYSVRGNACTSGAECDTNNCVDGACCETASCGTCQACNLAGSEGRCANVANGMTHTSCSGASACNGSGACLLTRGQACTAGSQCLTGNCADGFCCDTACAGACDVCSAAKGASTNGTCTLLPAGSAGEPSCAPNVCSGTANTCPGACTKDADCSGGSYCASDGKCKAQKALGATCNLATECIGGSCRLCASSYCTDGVCCDRACDGLCEACSKVRKGTTAEDGKCGFAADGEPDRLGRCSDSGTSETGCKTDGKCGGSGACRYYSKTTSCGSAGATCVGNKASGRFCDGTGTCAAAGATTDCAPFKCIEGTGCPSTCASDTDCLTTAYCNASKLCVPRAGLGIACTENRECDSNVCADGNCCERTCDQLCEACNQKGTEGKCAPRYGAPVAGHGACPPGDATKPCEAPSCDGTVRDKCLGRPGADVVCQEKSCADGVEKPEARCDGKGTCAAATPRACKPFVCALDGCKSTCADNADCQAPTTCDTKTGECVASGKCDADGYTAVSADGATRKDCRPFLCEPSGTCRESCSASTDCLAPNVCDSNTSKCVAPPSADSGDGSCSATTTRPAGAGGTLLLFGLVFLSRLRRRGVTGSVTAP